MKTTAKFHYGGGGSCRTLLLNQMLGGEVREFSPIERSWGEPDAPRTYPLIFAMSAFGSKADIPSTGPNVCF
jgi:hypothetical protein